MKKGVLALIAVVLCVCAALGAETVKAGDRLWSDRGSVARLFDVETERAMSALERIAVAYDVYVGGRPLCEALETELGVRHEDEAVAVTEDLDVLVRKWGRRNVEKALDSWKNVKSESDLGEE